MADTRTQNGTRNIIAGLVNRVILLFLPLFVRSVMVATLGSQYLGLSSLFTSILTVLNLSELGFGAALTYSMYKPVAENDMYRICTILGYYKKIYNLISIIVLVAGTAFLPFLPHFIGGEWPREINIYILYYIYLINVVLSYALFAHKRALLIAYQRYDMITNINTMLSIGLYIIQIILLFVTSNYYLYVCILPLSTIIDNLWVAFVTKKMFPNLECKTAISKEDKHAIKQHVKGLGIQKLCSTSRNSFDSIIISMNLGLAATAIYNNYYSIMLAVHMFLYQIPNAIRASVGNSIASENTSKNFKNYSLFNFIYMWISGWCAICLLCLFQPFMQLWMGETNMLSEKTVILYCIYFMEFSLSDMLCLYRDAAGLWWYGK